MTHSPAIVWLITIHGHLGVERGLPGPSEGLVIVGKRVLERRWSTLFYTEPEEVLERKRPHTFHILIGIDVFK
ncbi:hypothetical protein TNCT_253241 [Trichonephila clavata]|uniref:Uncharacterized protein n=1 Tax=Trichonephila clavata TaxID=2740835 RepID=A0A8X6LYX2_TRICU|nr:hypothetical protein TNCT_253241 [Trichonephila clavata]